MAIFHNGLGSSEQERLSLLLEECGEVIQIIGKIQRHGYESRNPDDPRFTNRQLLEKELGDVFYATKLMTAREDVGSTSIFERMDNRHIKLQQYLHFNEAIQ